MITIQNELPKKTAIIYVRCATKRQLSGSSLDRQYRLCKIWCEANNVDITEIVSDVGIAYDGQHLKECRSPMKGNLWRMFKRLSEGYDTPDYFVYENWDILTKNVLLNMTVREGLLELGVSPQTVDTSLYIDWSEPLSSYEKQMTYQT